MSTRHWFIIVYVADSERKQIMLVERNTLNCTQFDSDYDKASRMEFEWWILQQDDEQKDSHEEWENRNKKEKEAADYARELAKEQGLEFIGQSKTDGILD